MPSLALNNCTHIYKHTSSDLNLKLVLRPMASQRSLILQVSSTHKLDAAQSVGLLSTKDQADTENSISHHNTQTTICRALAEFENTI